MATAQQPLSDPVAGTPRRGAGRWNRRRVAGGLLTVVALAALVTGPQEDGAARPAAQQGSAVGVGVPTDRPAPVDSGPPALDLAPGNGVAAVSVVGGVTVTARSSTLDSVRLVDGAGRSVAGRFEDGRRRWHATAPLSYDTRYTLHAVATPVATGASGSTGTGGTGGSAKLEKSHTFRTVKPANLTMPYLRANATLLLADRKTYGVGQPVVVQFDEDIPDRKAAQRTLDVTTSPRVDGAWHWFSDREVHWRPRAYWTPGTKVTVTARAYGAHLGRGLYGQRDATASFTIGRSQIAIADDKTFHIQVYIDGKLVRTIPTAMGKHISVRTPKGIWIDYRTHSGVHVVLGRAQVVRMNSASYGLTGPDSYDEDVYWTTHISYSGEYIHAAPWSVAQQGNSDASHGCVNVNTDNAIWFYNTFIPGDIVDIRNTGLALDPTDGLGDWTLSWADWIKGSALPYRPHLPAGRPA